MVIDDHWLSIVIDDDELMMEKTVMEVEQQWLVSVVLVEDVDDAWVVVVVEMHKETYDVVVAYPLGVVEDLAS